MYLYNLITEYRNGNRSSLEILFNKFNPLIKKISRELNYEESNSDLNIFFIELINNIDLSKFNKISDFIIISYIRTALLNKKVDLIRKRKKINIESYHTEMNGLIYDYYSRIEDEVCFKNYIQSRLKGVQQKVIIYKYLKGYSDIEISQILNISRQAVNSAKNRAFKTIREDYTDII